MPVITQNSTATPMTFLGSAVQYGGIIHQYGTYASVPYIPHIIANLPDEKDDILGSQVVGLVPVFSCESKECRSGKYGSDDANFMLPVFAQNQISISGDYYNDTNSFLFNLPSDTVLTHHKFYLDKKIDGTWVQQTELKDNSYGIYYGLGELCDSLAYLGYNIYWNLVLHTFGEGVYRFRINGSFTCSVIPSQGYLKFNDTFTESITATFSVDTLGHLCDAYYFDHSLTHSQLMQDYTNAINAYQNATYPTPLFVATWNAGLGRIDISSPLGENGVITDNGTFYPNGYLKQDLTGGVTSICDPINCYASPPFCLKTWSCYGVDLTTRFDASYTGGVIGDVNKSNAGNLFSFCCTGKPLMNVYKQSEIKIFYWKVAGEVTTFHSNEIWTFTANYGYDICSPIPITSGWTMPQALMFVVTSINTYQATLSSVEFTASYVTDIVYGDYILIKNNDGVNVTCKLVRTGVKINSSNNGYVAPNIAINAHDFNYNFVVNGTIDVTLNYNFSLYGGSTNVNSTFLRSGAFTWKDRIRVGGEFGYEQTDYERKSIKYQTGVVNKIRDEAILKFTWKSSSLPFWFHERFKGYALMADELKVSDYNLNNADYNLKLFSVQSDSSYVPDYKGYTRYTKVKCDFKAKIQNLKRTRCC